MKDEGEGARRTKVDEKIVNTVWFWYDADGHTRILATKSERAASG